MAHTIGRFQLQEEIADVCAAKVYRAYDPAFGRTVALKLLDYSWDEEARERILGAARRAASLAHPNVVAVYDAGVEDGQAFVAMELVDGPSLAALIQRSAPFRPAEVVPWLEQIAGALDHAHRRGLVHGDLKPSNVLSTRDGLLKLADFGSARLGVRISAEKFIGFGTPAYMAPEQLQGAPGGGLGPGASDHRCDVFALGVIAYELFTGSRPFDGATPVATMQKAIYAPPPPMRTFVPSLADVFDVVLSRALEKSPAARYGSCGELVAAIRDAVRATEESRGRAEDAPAAIHTCRLCGAGLAAAARYCYRCGAPKVDPFKTVPGASEDADAGLEPLPTKSLVERLDAKGSVWVGTAPIASGPTDPAAVETAPLEEPSYTSDLDEPVAVPPHDVAAVQLLEPTWASAPRADEVVPRYDAGSWPPAPREVAPHEVGARGEWGAAPPAPQPLVRAELGVEPPAPRPPSRTPVAAIVATLAVLLLLVGALGVWAVMAYRGGSAEAEEPAAATPDGGVEARADGGTGDAPADAGAPAEAPHDHGGAHEPGAAPAGLVIREETANVVDAGLASGPPDGRFARIRPGGSLAIALPNGRVLRDNGGEEPDVRVVGDPGSSGPYAIFARVPSKGFVRIDRVRGFGSHDMRHHRVLEADAFKIVNTGTTDLLVDAIVPLRVPQAR